MSTYVYGGRMNLKFSYFRHAIDADDDAKMREFSRLLGRKSKEAYHFYWRLVELCASMSQDGQTEFVIHLKTLCDKWETSTSRAREVCADLAESALIGCTQCVHHVTVDIPNLPKYLGSYSTKKRKERKGKEREKEAQIIALADIEKPEAKKILPHVKTEEILSPKDFKLAGISSVDDLLGYWNENLQLLGFPPAPFSLGGNFIQSFFLINRRLIENKSTWIEYVERVKNSEFLVKKRKGGPPPITWLLNENNFDKVICGQFDRDGSDADDDKLLMERGLA